MFMNIRFRIMSAAFFFCVALSFTASLSCLAREDDGKTMKASIAFSQYDGTRQEIFVAAYDGTSWSAPEQVTYDHAENVHPVLSVDQGGNFFLCWTSSDEGSISVKYSRNTGDAWSEAKTLVTDFESSTSPAVAVDSDNVIWIVFSGDVGEYDDIYYIQFDAEADAKAEKQNPVRVNASNDSPDIKPSIVINDDGNPVVTWEGYRGDSYVLLQSTWDGSQWGKEKIITAEDAIEEEDESDALPALPDYVQEDSHVSLLIVK